MSLTAPELAAMRAVTDDFLPGTAVVSTQTLVSDGGGGGSMTVAPSGTFACRIAPITTAGEGERLEGGRISVDAEYVVTLPFDVAVTTNSRLTIAGQNYNVEAIRDRTWNLTTRVEVQKEV